MLLLKEGSQGTTSELFVPLPLPEPWPAPQPLFFPSGSDVAEWFFRAGMAERELIAWARDVLLPPDSCFLDIGAHVGTYTIACGAKALRTYAFECSSRSFCYLAANVALHDLTERVSLYNTALGGRNYFADYIQRSQDGGGSGIQELCAKDRELPRTKVPVWRLDDLQLQLPARIGLVKIDVEGAEKDVLIGAQETLRASDWPPILFESWGEWKSDAPARELRRELFELLQSFGYAVREAPHARDMFVATYAAAIV